MLLLFNSYFVGTSQAQLQVGFYAKSCPNVEAIVGGGVREAAASEPNTAVVLLRFHFHDCFVEAKGASYEVETGRRDGLVSNVESADNMPDVTDSVDTLKTKFLQKGLTEKDLVVLTAAHTIGTTACFFMNNRLYNFPAVGGSDPSINPAFLSELKSMCPKNGPENLELALNGDVNFRLLIDRGSEQVFDNQILQNIRSGFVVLQSDAALYQDEEVKAVIDSYFAPLFEADFADAMMRMGRIRVLTGVQSTIRRS